MKSLHTKLPTIAVSPTQCSYHLTVRGPRERKEILFQRALALSELALSQRILAQPWLDKSALSSSMFPSTLSHGTIDISKSMISSVLELAFSAASWNTITMIYKNQWLRHEE
ncbi:hypothetical protein EYC84_008392 [Monilinia fructicola]|uniref:Uncharacterized protein n=1 Tax=Monilinia fructicola TaxID=38448 RepID=A0A5M9JF71_MONFR|nr:hypothetical protein EYC84_008392 [Monilinia fructicola]